MAQRKRALSPSGVPAAIVTATAATWAGWSWAWILIAFFVSSTALSRFGQAAKLARTAEVVEKSGERDMWQVLANGSAFAACAVMAMIQPNPLWNVAAAGAMASSTADTWSTEIGTLSSSAPRSITSWKRVTAGTSGGVTLAGTIAQVLGAAFIAALVLAFEWPARAACAAIVGGIGGSLIDSLLGATVQGKRWCEQCKRGTERAVHSCGSETVHWRGVKWIGNDMVNVASSTGGALLGLLCMT